MTILPRGLAAAAAALALTLTAGAAAAEALNFGIISTESQQNQKPKWQPLLDDMAKATGLEIQPFFASDYAGVIEGMRFGKVQMAWYGNKSAMEAVDRADAEVFAQTTAADGTDGYYSVIIVPKDSKIEKIEDLLTCDKSLNFGLGDPNSTSGYLVPMTFVFGASKIDPKACFKTVTNANHETNAMAVANGQVDAAANNTENLALIEKNKPDAFAKIKVIWKSPLIPSDPIAWRKDLPEDQKARIRDFFLTYGTDKSKGDVAHEKEVLAGLDWGPFKPSTDAQLLPIRVMEAQKAMGQIEADAALSDADKQAKIAPLTVKKAELEAQLAAQPKP